jgi:hypothetical protein
MRRSDKAHWYSLKKAYGLPIEILKPTNSEINTQTGKYTTEDFSVPIPRALVLAGTVRPKFVYDLGYLASNNNFTYGGEFNMSDIIVAFGTGEYAAALMHAGYERQECIVKREQEFIVHYKEGQVTFNVYQIHQSRTRGITWVSGRTVGESHEA